MRQDPTALGKCLNCGAELAPQRAYCAECGQKIVAARLTLREIGDDLLQAFVQADRSVLSLIGQLLVRPGTVALDYVRGRRKRYFGPFAFLAVTAGIISAEIVLTGFHVVTADSPNAVAGFLQNHVNVVFLAEVPLLAAFLRLFDLRGGFTFAEHLVLSTYSSGMRILLSSLVVVPAWYLFSPGGRTASLLYGAYLLAWLIYFGLATSQFLRGRRALAWCKGILAAIFTWASIQGLATLAGRLVS